MATVEELTGLLKGLADVVKSQQQANATALQRTTEQLQNFSSTVETLSKTIITPQTTPTQSSNDSPAGLRLPNITLPIYTGIENLDRFIDQITSLLQSSGVAPRYHVTYLKQQTQKDARAYDALCEAEKLHKNLLGDQPGKASPAEFTKYYDAVWKPFAQNAANRGINRLETYFTSITPCNKGTKNLSLNSQIDPHKPSWNWGSLSQT